MATQRDKLEDIDYWRALNKGFSITENPWPSNPREVDFTHTELDQFCDSLRDEGYFSTSPCIPESKLDRLRECTLNVIAASNEHWPAYALLYDEFFEVLASLGQLLRRILGESFLIVPDEPDVYFIPTSNDSSGAEPHRDSLRDHKSYTDEGLPGIINLWIPLTDATPTNSCMHVIPAHCDPHYRTPKSNLPMPEQVDISLLQRARAVPAKAGSVLGWSTELIHWGGPSSNAADIPRLSFAMYFQRGDIPKQHPTATRVPFNMAFDYRLYLLEKVFRDPDGKQLDRFIQP